MDFYQSEVKELDIVLNPFGSVNLINRWVSDKTRGKITNILTSLAPDTQMVVANAVYFNANWADPFSPDLTRREDFFISPTEVITPLTMRTHSLVAYTESEELGCKMIGIPYKVYSKISQPDVCKNVKSNECISKIDREKIWECSSFYRQRSKDWLHSIEWKTK